MSPSRALLAALLLSVAGATKVESQERPSEHRRGFFISQAIDFMQKNHFSVVCAQSGKRLTKRFAVDQRLLVVRGV